MLFSYGHAAGPRNLPEKIGLFTFGKFDKNLIKDIEAEGEEVYGVKIKLVKNLPFPIEDTSSYSYNVTTFYDALEKQTTKKYKRVMGLTHKRLVLVICPIFIFGDECSRKVIGVTKNDLSTAIVSDKTDEGENFFSNKEMTGVFMHELGHMCGLEHCEDTTCVMIGFGHLENDRLCKKCACLLEDLREFYKTHPK